MGGASDEHRENTAPRANQHYETSEETCRATAAGGQAVGIGEALREAVRREAGACVAEIYPGEVGVPIGVGGSGEGHALTGEAGVEPDAGRVTRCYNRQTAIDVRREEAPPR